MLLSSSLDAADGGWFSVNGVVAKHSPEDVDAASGKCDERLFVGLPLAAFPVVVGSGCGTVFQAGEGSEVIGPEESAVESAWPVQVTADSSGITWDRGKAGDAGEAVAGVEAVQVATDVREKCSCEYGSKPRHTQENIGAVVLPEQILDLGIDVGNLCISCPDLLGQSDDQSRAHGLGRQDGVLRLTGPASIY